MFFLRCITGLLRFDRFCSWPVDELEALWQLMLAMNRPALAWMQVQQAQAQPKPQPPQAGSSGGGSGGGVSAAGERCVITLSHFMPRPELPFNRRV